MTGVSRRELIATVGLATIGCSAESVRAEMSQSSSVTASDFDAYRRRWLTASLKFRPMPQVAMKFYGLIAAITTKGQPRGALFVKGHMPANQHQPKLHVNVNDVVAGQGSLVGVNGEVGHWKLDNLRVRVVKKGQKPTSAPAKFGSPRHMWADPKQLLKLNDLVPGLEAKTKEQMISSTCAKAYVEFVGGSVEPCVPLSVAGRAGLFEIVGSSRDPITMTDNFVSYVDYGPGSEVDILVRPLDSPQDPERVLGTLKATRGLVPLLFSNDTPIASPSQDVITHSAAYWQLFKPQSIGGTAANHGLPKFFAGIAGEDLNSLTGIVWNNGDPICNGGQIEEGV